MGLESDQLGEFRFGASPFRVFIGIGLNRHMPTSPYLTRPATY